VTVPGVGLAPVVNKAGEHTASASADLQKAADLAKKSTASLGKFQEKLPTALEKKVRAKRSFLYICQIKKKFKRKKKFKTKVRPKRSFLCGK
jgi:hypothetical protein